MEHEEGCANERKRNLIRHASHDAWCIRFLLTLPLNAPLVSRNDMTVYKMFFLPDNFLN